MKITANAMDLKKGMIFPWLNDAITAISAVRRLDAGEYLAQAYQMVIVVFNTRIHLT